MATGGTASAGSVTHADTAVDYYDIMVVGKTGMGKSTTADKLLIANPDGCDYKGAQHTEPVVENQRMNSEDLSIWLLSDAPDEISRVEQRLKNLIFFRGLNEPHQEVNSRSDENDPTLSFELISNESTRVRVLDVPGFFGVGDAGTSVALAGEKAQSAVNVALGRMRMVLQIQATMCINFRRILYFLPIRGSLRRSDSYLETELTTLANYFGKSIFLCMVVVITYTPDAYEDGHNLTFSESAIARTSDIFCNVLSRALPRERNLPSPPIVFISMMDTCETILKKIMNANVTCDFITLEFDTQMCARCGNKTKFIKSKKITVCVDETDTTNTIPYDESTCHPLFLPKYTKIKKILGGIVHLTPLGRYFQNWPRFGEIHEECARCGKAPGSHGCTLVKTRCELYGEYFMVDHTNNTREPISFEFEDVVVERDPTAVPEQTALEHVEVTRHPQAQRPIAAPSGAENENVMEVHVTIPPNESYIVESKGT